MDIEKSAEVLTGMALDQAVVRVKVSETFASEAEAWADTADRIIEESGYKIHSSTEDIEEFPEKEYFWYSLRGLGIGRPLPIRALALTAAKLDYVQRNTRPAAPEPVQGDEEWNESEGCATGVCEACSQDNCTCSCHRRLTSSASAKSEQQDPGYDLFQQNASGANLMPR